MKRRTGVEHEPSGAASPTSAAKANLVVATEPALAATTTAQTSFDGRLGERAHRRPGGRFSQVRSGKTCLLWSLRRSDWLPLERLPGRGLALSLAPRRIGALPGRVVMATRLSALVALPCYSQLAAPGLLAAPRAAVALTAVAGHADLHQGITELAVKQPVRLRSPRSTSNHALGKESALGWFGMHAGCIQRRPCRSQSETPGAGCDLRIGALRR